MVFLLLFLRTQFGVTFGVVFLGVGERETKIFKNMWVNFSVLGKSGITVFEKETICFLSGDSYSPTGIEVFLLSFLLCLCNFLMIM